MKRAVVSLGLALFACATAPAGPAKSSGEVEVSVDRIVPKPQSLDEADVEVSLKISNTTDSPVKLERVDYEIDTAQVAGVITGSSNANASLEALQTAELSFSQGLRFPEEVEAYKALLEKGSFPITLKGALVMAGGKKLPFEKKSEIATPTLPQFVVNLAQAARYEKEGVSVTIYLRLVNENVFPVGVEGVKYTVYVEDKKVKTEQAAIGVRLIGGAAEEYEVGATLDEKALGKAKLQEVLQRGKVSYRVAGKVETAKMTIPFEHSGEIGLGSSE